MTKAGELKKHLKRGQVYRRKDLEQWSNAVDRHVEQLVAEGTLRKLSTGLYYYPKLSVFGNTPPDEKTLVRSFLNDDDFLLTSPNDFNSLGVGTTQLYNKRVVFNHKRHGEFSFGGRAFSFHSRHKFPNKVTKEYLLVELVSNLKNLAEDPEFVLKNVSSKMDEFDLSKLKHVLKEFGSVRAKNYLTPMIAKAEGRNV